MKRKVTSQREAARMRQRIAYLTKQLNEAQDLIREQRRYWRQNTTRGKEIFTLENPLLTSVWSVWTARRLGHAVVVENNGSNLTFYAMPLPGEPIS